MPVSYEVSGDLDLIGGVVVVVPRCRRLPETGLQHHRGHQQRQHDHESEPPEQLGAPRRPSPAPGGDERDEEARHDPGRAHEAQIPVSPGGPYEVTEEPVRVHRRRMERPRVGAELRDHDRDEHAERPQDRPGPPALDLSHRAGTASRGGDATGSGFGCGGGIPRYAAAALSTNQVIGSSKNPLYASEWTKRARRTGASD